jgi:hypothetical protein
MSEIVTLLLTVLVVAMVGFSLTLLGAFGLVWLSNAIDRWLD